MIRKSLLAIVITTVLYGSFVKPQTAQTTPDGDKDTCAMSCPNNIGECHLIRARYLITGIHFPTRGCPDEDFSYLAALKGVERSSAAVVELEKAIANSSRTGSGLLYVYEILTDAKITLGNSLLAAGRYDDANKSFTDAYNQYIKISGQITNKEDLASLGSGMIRAGKSVEAIKYLTPLASSSPTRAYLLAESYFSLGQREVAAKFYETWIELGCNSDPTMLLNDEYGPAWALLFSNRPRCEQLPLELRARLELLQRQYKNLKNLPIKNYPSSLMLTH